ncbi:MAG: translational GTPase TypA [Chloroflexi bacterium]|nr:translational GTPase TypA [Chloroflexota bacterium]
MTSQAAIRNVAIIAHVDHGKTTLVDAMLKQSHIFRENEAVGELILDSNDLERERGITILAKNTAITYRGIKINIIDTPGHADFGGEVERVLNMADGCLLLVDAVEGPMPQTRFVLRVALQMGLRPIVVINKIDRSAARIREVLDEIQDLFLELATDADQLDFPVLYAIGRNGTAARSLDEPQRDLQPLFDTIVDAVPPPQVQQEGGMQLLVTALDYDNHKGRIAIGRLSRGTARLGMSVIRITRSGSQSRHTVTYLFTHLGLQRIPVEEAHAGDIIALTGIEDAGIGETLADATTPEALPTIQISEPTVEITIGVNTSPAAGREGRFVTSRQLGARLQRELATNVALRVEATEAADVFRVAGRGELHLSILIETMRREGYEFEVSRPEVILKRDSEDRLLEPVERATIDVIDSYVGPVTELLSQRRGQMVNLAADGNGSTRLEYHVPTRGLIGLRNALLTATRGEAVLHALLLGYEPYQGEMPYNRLGALVASEPGVAVTYGLHNAQARGTTFIGPGTEVYEGMIIGVQTRSGDLLINVCKEKQKTNVRSSTSDIAVQLTPHTVLSLEQSLDFLARDELLEATPQSLRLRKRYLTEQERTKAREREREQRNRQPALAGER